MYKRPVGTIYLLKRAELAVRSCMEVALAQFDLTPAQFLMLFRLRDHAELSGAALARELGIRPQSIVDLTGPLERNGFLERSPSKQHGRVLHLRLTSAGKKLLADALRVAARVESELLEDVQDEALSALQEGLSKLWSRAESHELHPGSIRARAQQLMRDHLALKQRRPLRARSGVRERTRVKPDRRRRPGSTAESTD
jgi:DNA-binding MarR family transcriptional regulator